jgi:hypothetical protein
MTGGPLPAVLEATGAVALRVDVDRERGLVVVSMGAWPWARLVLAPECAAELSLRLIDKAADLRRPGEPAP